MNTAAVRDERAITTNGAAPQLPRYLTLKEAADICRAGQSTLRAAARRRELGHTRLGRRLLFTESDLRAYLQQRRVEVVEAAR